MKRSPGTPDYGVMSHYFVLQSGAWAEADRHLCRPLIGTRKSRSPQTPWVAVARGTERGGFDLVTRVQANGSGAAIVEQAKDSLARHPSHLQVAEQAGFWLFKKPSLVRVLLPGQPQPTLDAMDDLSAEQVLNPALLDEVAALVRSDSILVAIPKRGWLMACPGQPGELVKMTKMHEIANGVFGRAGTDALTEHVYFVQHGALVGVSVQDQAGGYLSLYGPEESEWLV